MEKQIIRKKNINREENNHEVNKHKEKNISNSIIMRRKIKTGRKKIIEKKI
jgi:hypothetical protein